jgi:hypothetical protein
MGRAASLTIHRLAPFVVAFLLPRVVGGYDILVERPDLRKRWLARP